MPALRLRRGGCARRLLAQPLLEVLLEPAAQRDHLRVPLELIGDVVEAAVVQLVQAPQGELDVAGILGGGKEGHAVLVAYLLENNAASATVAENSIDPAAGLAEHGLMLMTSRDVDPQAVLDLIVRHQQSPGTACAYLGTDPQEIRHDLEELDQHWLETVRVAVAEDGRVLGAAVIEWDEDLGRSWVHGPWVEEGSWREHSPALLAAVTELAPVAHHEMYAGLAHEGMAWLADRCGWQVGEGNVELTRTAPAPTGLLDPGLRSADDADEAAVRELHEREFPGTYADTAELLDPGSRYSTWVLAPEGEVLGYVAFQRQEESTAYVDFIAVHPGARRSGVGQRLIDGAHQVSGRERLALTVDEHRPGARAFYDALGFRVEAETRPYRLRPSDA